MRWDVGPSLQFRGHQHGAKARGEIRQGHPERCDAAGLRDRGVILHALRLVVKVTGCKTRLRTDGHDSLPPPPNGEAQRRRAGAVRWSGRLDAFIGIRLASARSAPRGMSTATK